MLKIGDSVLKVLMGGQSLLDSKQGLQGSFRAVPEAESYLLSYGYDFQDPIENAEIQGTVQEAIRFVRKYFLKPENPDGLPIEVPKKISDCQDIREMLMFASGGLQQDETHLSGWACAVLKVVHTISHVDRDMRSPYFADIQKQIFDRFYRHLHRDENQCLYLGRSPTDPLRVDLIEFQVKPKKARDSTLMKLLHKPESVAEEVFDRVGLRFITATRFDAVRLVHFLEQTRAIVAANIKPSRSRNTLIEPVGLGEAIEDCFQKIENGVLSPAEGLKILESIPAPNPKTAENRFSSEHYRAIQFTCRQLIKLSSPLADQIRDLKSRTKNLDTPLDPALVSAIDRLDPKLVQRVVRFFYPFEIQVMDQESFIENEKGRSAHAEYKKAQQQAAMMRIMGSLADGFNRTP